MLTIDAQLLPLNAAARTWEQVADEARLRSRVARGQPARRLHCHAERVLHRAALPRVRARASHSAPLDARACWICCR